MADVIHSEIYDHENGVQYLVEVTYDYGMAAPDAEMTDCHGVVVRDLDFDPSDPVDLDDYIERYCGSDSPRAIEAHAQFSMLRLLNDRNQRRYNYVWYDVWESLKKAKKEWGHKTDEAAMAAVEADYEHLRGWYDNDWCWCVVSVYPVDEDGNKLDDAGAHLGGVESLVLNDDQREYFEEIITDKIEELEYEKTTVKT